MDDIQIPRVTIDLDASMPVAQQIADGLRVLLVRGELRPGDRLPSSRRLATDLAVHFNTVAEAYRQLEAEGWLALRRRRGTEVLAPQAPAPGSEERDGMLERFGEQLERLIARYRAGGLSAGEIQARVDALLRDYREVDS